MPLRWKLLFTVESLWSVFAKEDTPQISDESDFEMPSFLDVEREVSQDPKYSSYHISLKHDAFPNQMEDDTVA